MPNESSVAKGSTYEQFVQDVYQAILNNDEVKNIKVAHNVQIAGNSGCNHQIDVYWEFSLGGQTYKTAIECKAFNTNVPIGKIRDFYGVVLDVPGLTGIFATLIGYQSGAKRYAEHYGISLKELREPTALDWKGRVQDIHLNIHLVSIEIVKFEPRVSPAYLATLNDGDRIEIQTCFATDEPIVFEKSGNSKLSYDELLERLPTNNKQENGMTHFLPLPDYVLKSGALVIDIDGIDYVYNVKVDTETIVSRGKELAKAIVKDVASGKLTFIDKKGTVKTTHG